MAVTTQLSTIATPGRRQTFSAKGAGVFTSLIVSGTPGRRQTFTAKAAALIAGTKGEGVFTSLIVSGTPGQRQTFTAKTEIEIVIPPVIEETSTRDAYSSMVYGIRPTDRREDIKQIIQDDEELVEIILMLAESGVLD